VLFFVAGSQSEMLGISVVEYVLHPTFPDPVREIEDPAHCFALETEAWGSFELSARLLMKDGADHELKLVFQLLRDNWPLGPIAAPADLSLEELRAFACLADAKWDWRKLSTVSKQTGADKDTARKQMESLERRLLVRRAPFLSIDNEELWGATCRIGLLPTPLENNSG
jgi:hypothetical protein